MRKSPQKQAKVQFWLPGLPCAGTGVYPAQSYPSKHFLSPSVSPINTLQGLEEIPSQEMELDTSEKPSPRSALRTVWKCNIQSLLVLYGTGISAINKKPNQAIESPSQVLSLTHISAIAHVLG